MFDSHICPLQAVFNLTVRASESQLTTGELTTADVEHQPVLCIIPKAENRTRGSRSGIAAVQEEDHSSKTRTNGTECVWAPTEGPIPRAASDGEGVCKHSVQMEPYREAPWSAERLTS